MAHAMWKIEQPGKMKYSPYFVTTESTRYIFQVETIFCDEFK
jgi:hypothetical protein